MGTTAACSKVTLSGLDTSRSARAATYSANAPRQVPNTSSPGRKVVTRAPTASTRLATSQPRSGFLGARTPKPARRIAYGVPVSRCQTPWSTPAATTRSSTSPSPATGVGDFAEPQNVNLPVGVADDRLHRLLPRLSDIGSPFGKDQWLTVMVS